MESIPREIQILAENQSSVSNRNKEEQEGICLSTALPASLRKLHRVILKPLGNTSTLLCYKSLKSLCFGGGKQLAQAWSACSPPWIKLQPYVSCQGSFTLAGAPQGSVLSSPSVHPLCSFSSPATSRGCNYRTRTSLNPWLCCRAPSFTYVELPATPGLCLNLALPSSTKFLFCYQLSLQASQRSLIPLSRLHLHTC